MIDPEYLLERITLKRKASHWRLLCLFLVGILLGSIFISNLDPQSLYKGGYIARVRIEGLMLDDLNSIKKLRDLADNSAVKAVIIDIDSGGGSAVAGEEYHIAIRHIAKHKPVVAVLEQIAASSAYMTATACDYIVSHKFTLTGSIGAIMQTYEVTDLADKVGVRFINIKSSPLKAAPNPFEKYTPEVEAVQNDLMQDALAVFSDMVKERRNLSETEIKQVNNGRLYTGGQALRLKLVDAIGDERSAIAWLQKERGLSARLSVKDYALAKKPNRLERAMDSIHSLISGMNAFSHSPKLS